jgi:hypothetical protein
MIITTTTTIDKLFDDDDDDDDDGAYECNEIFKYLSNNGILSCNKVKKNARVRWMKKGNFL